MNELFLLSLKIQTSNVIIILDWIARIVLGIKVLRLSKIIPNNIVYYCITFTRIFANLSWKIIIKKTLVAVAELELYVSLFIVTVKSSQK